MKLTNKHNLPAPVVAAVMHQQSAYKGSYQGRKADISATGLLKPPQIAALEREHWEQLEEDVTDRIWALLGSLMHGILEAHGEEQAELQVDEPDLIEHRMYAEVMGWTISGQLDRYVTSTGLLQDYKTASVWEHVGGIKPEREMQLNILAWLLRQEGRVVNNISIVSFYRDWSKNQAKRGGDYPQLQVGVHMLPLWTPEEQRLFIESRVKMHQDARKGIIARCTPEDRWAKPTEWAVMKEGRKSAVKLHDSEESATGHAEALGAKHYVHERPGEDVRCENYCSVAEFCPQRGGQPGLKPNS